ncbi:unnamed protein product, partial [Closterium sp. Naga37s-1]
ASAGVGRGVAGDAAGGRHGRDGAPPGAAAQQALPPRLPQCAHGSDPTAAMAAGRNAATGVAGAAECGGGLVAGAVLAGTGGLHGGRRAGPHCGPATPKDPYIEVRVLKDAGAMYLDDKVAYLEANTLHLVRKTDAEPLILKLFSVILTPSTFTCPHAHVFDPGVIGTPRILTTWQACLPYKKSILVQRINSRGIIKL